MHKNIREAIKKKKNSDKIFLHNNMTHLLKKKKIQKIFATGGENPQQLSA